MSRKSSKIMSQKTPPKKEPMSGSAKFGIVACVVVLAALGFAVAERLGFTGTSLLFQGEVVLNADEASESGRRGNADEAGAPAAAATRSTAEKARNAAETPAQKKSAPAAAKSRTSVAKAPAKKKSASAKKSAEPVPPLPLAAFEEISRRPHTWPGFVRLTRSRNIMIVDARTGTSMGRMDVPAGTVVKIQRVNANGSLEVFDRTGQKFQVEATGTNFAAAYAAAKNKPKKKAKKPPEKQPAVVAKTDAPKPEAPVPEPEKKPARTSSGSTAISAFGVVIDDEEWDEAEADD